MPELDDDDGADFATRVRDFTASFDPTQPALPLTHISSMFAFRTIVTGRTIDPQKCEVYDEELTYLFYGRPAYRVRQNTYHKLRWSVPVLFLLDPKKTYEIKRVVPFDSGAFHRGFYGNIFADRSQLSHFELYPSVESAQRLVTALYGGNKEYYAGQSEKALDITDFDFELQGLNYLAKQPGLQLANNGSFANERALDERASAIEIQVSEPIDIPSATIKLFVPETLLANQKFQRALTDWDLHDRVETYDGIVGPRSEAWVGQLYERVKQTYANLDRLKK